MISLGNPVAYGSAGTARRLRVVTTSGRETTAHVATYDAARTRVRLALLDPPEPLQSWAEAEGVTEAVNGGFFTKPDVQPLGELVLGGRPRAYTPFVERWSGARGALRLRAGRMAIGGRDELELEPDDDLLQAGPLLARAGKPVVEDEDPEGFSSTCEEFDSDITDGPYPRVAVGVARTSIVAVSVDGRAERDDGLTLVELAHLLVELGAEDALNLDGGASSSLITGGTRRNNPRDDDGVLLAGGYPTATALVFF